MNLQTNIFSSHWQSPSNIALVKYWGKKGNQLPCNPSISFTLNQAISDTSIQAEYNENQTGISFEFLFENKANPQFEAKIRPFLDKISAQFQWMGQFHLKINSSNTFPHSSGIASSASAFSALALNLGSLHQQIVGKDNFDFKKTASFWARIGSGSACRSVYGGFNLWGKTLSIAESSDEYAVNIDNIVHDNFKSISDTILIVEKGQKSVSSSKGHALLNEHIFAQQRYLEAFKNTEILLDILKSGNQDAFISLVEAEALQLHALMMSSPTPFILMKPNTLKIIELILGFRNQTNQKVAFTLDAGANVHFLSLEKDNTIVERFIENELKQFCQDGVLFKNKIGEGPLEII